MKSIDETTRDGRLSRRLRLGCISMACASMLACGGGDDDTQVTVPEPNTPPPTPVEPVSRKALVPCDSLVGKTIAPSAFGVPSGIGTVVTATSIPAAAPRNESVRGVQRTTVPVPEYCKVVGTIAPVDPTAPLINFQVNLPTEWNLKAAQLGGSGMNGTIPAALNNQFNAPETQPAGVGSPLTRGFVEMGSDSGHTNTTPDWTLNNEAAENLAHLQLKKTKDAAVALTNLYYGATPKLVYFFGSSQGGREALMTVQKYPKDYDGVFSQVPILGFSSITLNPTVLAQKQTGAGWIRPGQRALVGTEVLRQCDALDGVVDGVASHYLACNAIFTDLPANAPSPWDGIRCQDGADLGDTCLSDAQIVTLRAIHSMTKYGYNLGYGAPGFAGWGPGGELRGWLLNATQPTASYNGGQGAAWFTGRIFGDLTQSPMTWDPAVYPTQHLALSRLSDATDPDLSAFLARGGKLIMKHNTADFTANYRELIRYYEQMVDVMGQSEVDKFVRMYIAPGQVHSMMASQRTAFGEVIPSQIDMVELLDDWVTGKSTPADSLVMEERTLTTPFNVTASLPLCRYPTYPRYRGGERSKASSYDCTR